ncbi:MAG: TIGR01212 family radical SAM protein [Thermodesulfovibrionales bacterium]
MKEKERYRIFGRYLKDIFGETVYKINVDAGFTCPNRDGTLGFGGCIYCNNDSFRPSTCKPDLTISEQIRNGIRYISERYRARRFLVYFQPFTNTYASVDELERLYREALNEPFVVGLSIGTRPDCVDEQKISLLQELSRQYFILVEYGLQSIYDKTLMYIKRGHTIKDFHEAVNLTVNRGIHIGVHIIVGFPTETRDEMLKMADYISEMPVGFLKIHQLQVVKNTALAGRYRREPFYTFQYDDYLDFLVDFIERLSPDIVLQRQFATAPNDILIAPLWDRSRQQITNDIAKRFKDRDAFQGSKCLCHRG